MNIVLAHGILGFDKIGIGGFDIANYFRGVKAALEASGYSVFVPTVNPLGSIEQRADQLGRKIVDHFQHAKPKSLIILAHSMGGLDARKALAVNSELASYTKALVTIGTPHQGSPIADRLAGNLIFTKLLYGNLLKLFGDSVAGLSNITTSFCKEFDMATNSVAEVNYYSIAGKLGNDASFFFKGLGGLINEDSDGVVPYSSAVKNTDGWNYLLDWPVDHAGLIGWFDLNTPSSVYDAHIARYKSLVDELSRIHK